MKCWHNINSGKGYTLREISKWVGEIAQWGYRVLPALEYHMALESTFASVDQFVPSELVGGAIGAAIGGTAVATGVEMIAGAHPVAVIGGGALAGAAATYGLRKIATDTEKHKAELKAKLLARAAKYEEKKAEKPKAEAEKAEAEKAAS